jgi:hypothetical protein
MAVHFVKDKYFVFKDEKIAETKFRTELSSLMLSKFGREPIVDQILLVICQ